MNLFAISANNERINIYNMSKPANERPHISFDALRPSYPVKRMEIPLIFTGIYSIYGKRGGRGGLYNYRKVYPIEDISLDATRRSSIYQRSCITNNIISLADDFGK